MLSKICDSIDGKKITEVVVGLIVVGFISWVAWGVAHAVDEETHKDDIVRLYEGLITIHRDLKNMPTKQDLNSNLKVLESKMEKRINALSEKIDLVLDQLPSQPQPSTKAQP